MIHRLLRMNNYRPAIMKGTWPCIQVFFWIEIDQEGYEVTYAGDVQFDSKSPAVNLLTMVPMKVN